MASSLLLSSRKSDSVLGTFESDAFHLSLRSDTELSQLHQYGYHRIPHIGESSDNIAPVRVASYVARGADCDSIFVQQTIMRVHTCVCEH